VALTVSEWSPLLLVVLLLLLLVIELLSYHFAYLLWCRFCVIVLYLCIGMFLYLCWFRNWPWTSNIARQQI